MSSHPPFITAIRLRAALEMAGLWHDVADRLESPAMGLSGGQQQRPCLARALILEPEILLLDEPAASPDPAAARDIEDLLLRLSGSRALILVSHGVAQARRVAARLALFGHGRLRGILPPEALDEDARSLFAEEDDGRE